MSRPVFKGLITWNGKHMKAKTRFFSLIVLGFFIQTVIVSVAAATTIMPLGDSITRGVTGSSDEVGYRRSLFLALDGAGYDVEFVGSLEDGTPFDFDRYHEGHSGWLDDEIADWVYDWLTDNQADIVLLHIGTNAVDESAADVEDILNEIDRFESENATTIWVILARIINRNCITDNPPCLESVTTTNFNNNVAAMAQNRIDLLGDKIVIVDMENGAGIDYHLNPPGDMFDDKHPFDTGFEKMADVWFSALHDPLADAGPDQIVDESDVVTMDGSNSKNPPLNPNPSYYWVQTEGTPVAISDPAAVQPTFTAPETGSQGETLTFRLTVTSNSSISTDTTNVKVNGHSSSSSSGGCFIGTITE